MTTFFLKAIAMFAMLLDHFGAVFGLGGWGMESLITASYYFRLAGRIAFPLFAFALTEGWIHTHDKQKYFSRICLGAIISEIPFTMAFYTANYQTYGGKFDFRFMPVFLLMAALSVFVYWYVVCNKKTDRTHIVLGIAALLPVFSVKLSGMWFLVSDELNVLYTFMFGIAIMYLVDIICCRKRKAVQIILLSACIVIGMIAYCNNADYGCMGAFLVLILFLVWKFSICQEKGKYIQGCLIFLWGMLFYGIMLQNWTNAICTLIPAVLVMFYNQKPGKVPALLKKSFYVIYPGHLLVLGIVNMIIKIT